MPAMAVPGGTQAAVPDLPARVVVVVAARAAQPVPITGAALAAAWVCWAKDLTDREVRRSAPVVAVGLGAVMGKTQPFVLVRLAALTAAAALGRAPQAIVAAALACEGRYASFGVRVAPSLQLTQVTCNVV